MSSSTLEKKPSKKSRVDRDVKDSDDLSASGSLANSQQLGDEFIDDDAPLLGDDEILIGDDAPDEDAPLILEDDGFNPEDDAPPMKIEKPWTILSAPEFVEGLLNELVAQVGPFVPFELPESGEADADYKWKCLHVLRILGWNFGRLESVLDDQSKIVKQAGLLENPVPAGDLSGKISCSVCADEYDVNETSCLDCQHRFCNECYKEWIRDKLNSVSWEGLFLELTCPHKGCGHQILGPLIQRICSEADWEHYCKQLVRSFCQMNAASYSVCTHCNKIAKANYESKAQSVIVHCTCERSYCFKCGMAPHVPASCKDLEIWRSKDTDEEASIHFIKATTTDCPKCGLALDRTTACNHITCKCTYQFCFICKQKWGSCSIYSCSKFKTKEESEKANKTEFAKGFQTSSQWLVSHERYIAFGKKHLENKVWADKYQGEFVEKFKKKSLDFRELKPGGNPAFITEACETLGKAFRIMQYTLVWGFTHIPAVICPQKQIFEMQFKSYERMTKDLMTSLDKPIDVIDHLLCKRQYTMLQDNLIKQIEEAEDLMAMFSEKKSGDLSQNSALSRWTCPKETCNYSNHPVEQATACLLCKTARPEVQMSWFPD